MRCGLVCIEAEAMHSQLLRVRLYDGRASSPPRWIDARHAAETIVDTVERQKVLDRDATVILEFDMPLVVSEYVRRPRTLAGSGTLLPSHRWKVCASRRSLPCVGGGFAA